MAQVRAVVIGAGWAGESRFPLDVLRLAGVDLTTVATVERAFGVLESLIDELEQLL